MFALVSCDCIGLMQSSVHRFASSASAIPLPCVQSLDWLKVDHVQVRASAAVCRLNFVCTDAVACFKPSC